MSSFNIITRSLSSTSFLSSDYSPFKILQCHIINKEMYVIFFNAFVLPFIHILFVYGMNYKCWVSLHYKFLYMNNKMWKKTINM